MDNVTHSLAGLLLAEAAVRLRVKVERAEPTPRFRATAALASMVAANLPDADLFYTGVGGDRLRYMLYHRGYTHTILGALAGALVLWVAIAAAGRWRTRQRLMPADHRWLLGLLLVSTLSHLVLDWTNSYGVHPFWPVDNRWRYGDAVFIVEPWFWVVSVPALFLATASRAARVLLALVLAGGIALSWFVALVTTGAALTLTAGAIVSVLLAWLLGRDARVKLALAGWLGVTLAMMAGTARARSVALGSARTADPAAQMLDVVVSPLPSNAFCTTVITVEHSGTTYHVAVGRVSAAPRVVAAENCGRSEGSGTMLTPAARPSTPAVHWDGEWSAPVAELATLAHESCPALAALRFVRVPMWRSVGDSAVILGDVRYGGASGSSFASVRVPRRSAACPHAVPPWTPPRADLLSYGVPATAGARRSE